MLTADLARTRRRGDELRLIALDKRGQDRALALAATYLDLARAHVGQNRAAFEEACSQVATRPAERKLADGLRKLVEDRCGFDIQSQVEPRTLRSEVFLAASAAVRSPEPTGAFDREVFLAEQAQARGMPAAELERALYSDLRSEQVLLEFAEISPQLLVEHYQAAQAQAVLLKAVNVVAEVRCADPYAYRALFAKLKFLRLLHTIEAQADGSYRIRIDGPFSLFSSVTKYGLQLALALPALQACDTWKVVAQVRWGKERRPLWFRLQGGVAAHVRPARGESDSSVNGSPDALTGPSQPARQMPARLPDEVQTLLERFAALDTLWQVSPAAEILELPGIGLCVPDLRFQHATTGEVAYLEVMGYWSRDAVWRRVELVQKGLPFRIIFAVSQRLRVSEAVLAGELPGELYAYKGVISAREIATRLERQTAPSR